MLGKSAASKFWMLVIGFKSAAHSAGRVDRGSGGARLKPWVLNAVFCLLVALGAMIQGATPAIADNCGTIPSGSVLNGFPNPTLTCNAGPGINASAALSVCIILSPLFLMMGMTCLVLAFAMVFSV